MFIDLWGVETADNRPDGGDRGRDLLNDGGGALVGVYGLGMVAYDVVGDFEAGRGEGCEREGFRVEVGERGGGGRVGVGGDAVE